MNKAAVGCVLIFIAILSGCGESRDAPLADRLLADTVVVNGVASFPSYRSDYTITKAGTGYSVTDNVGQGGVSQLGNVTKIKFADVTIDLSIATLAASISDDDLNALLELYVAYFNRVPEAEGLAYWITQFKSGQSLASISGNFYTAALQYPSQTGYSATMSNADFIALIYKNVLGRSSVDAGGLDYWSRALASGRETRASLIRTILAAAHSLKGDSAYGWVARLLDNKVLTANYFAIQQGLSYNLAENNITKGMAIAAAVTPADTYPATKMIDAVFGAAGPQVISSNVSQAQAARLLLQAQFSASDAEIASVRAKGAAVWLNEQLNAPAGISGWNWLDSRGYNQISSDTKYYDQEYLSDRMIWNQLLTAPDAVRKRVALALSEMMVVSVAGVSTTWRGYAMASYWDGLVTNAFGNFRTLLENVSLNVATGRYLNALGNQKENSSGRQPDENYAREVMQLYTIGLYQLNLDGTEKRDADGNRIETYTASDVSNLARVFTGYQAPLETGTPVLVPLDNNRTIATTGTVRPPMRLIASQHSLLAASFLGTTIAANTDGATALRIALDTLFQHPNVGPFFSKQMIQRLVTSNPSPAYVARVATVFNNNGSGVRGDLKAVFSAILLDSEARSDAALTQNGAGKLREPMLRLVQWGRTFADVSVRDRWKIGDLSNPATQLSQSPLHAGSVFNFFRPGYVPPSSAMSAAGVLAPEFQLVNESAAGGYLNYMQDVIRSGFYTTNSDVSGNKEGGASIAADYTNELALVTNPGALVARLNLLLCAGRLSSASQTLIVQTLSGTTVTAASSSSAKLDRIAMAVLLVMASSDYLIQK